MWQRRLLRPGPAAASCRCGAFLRACGWYAVTHREYAVEWPAARAVCIVDAAAASSCQYCRAMGGAVPRATARRHITFCFCSDRLFGLVSTATKGTQPIKCVFCFAGAISVAGSTQPCDTPHVTILLRQPDAAIALILSLEKSLV